jgi:hypothetical protein
MMPSPVVRIIQGAIEEDPEYPGGNVVQVTIGPYETQEDCIRVRDALAQLLEEKFGCKFPPWTIHSPTTHRSQ